MSKRADNERVEIVKKIIKENIDDARCGVFDTRNILGDIMYELYNKDGLKVDICYDYSYFEVFGLNDKELCEVFDFYNGLIGRD